MMADWIGSYDLGGCWHRTAEGHDDSSQQLRSSKVVLNSPALGFSPHAP